MAHHQQVLSRGSVMHVELVSSRSVVVSSLCTSEAVECFCLSVMSSPCLSMWISENEAVRIDHHC